MALGVTGGIAAYKSAALCRAMAASGASVDVLLTGAAARFVGPAAFEAAGARRASVSEGGAAVERAAAEAGCFDLLVVAPLTARTLARLALGLCDDALVSLALAARAPWLLAPAMEPRMWRHPSTQRNARRVADWGATFVGPAEGRLASGAVGLGRMAEPEEIAARARSLLEPVSAA